MWYFSVHVHMKKYTCLSPCMTVVISKGSVSLLKQYNQVVCVGEWLELFVGYEHDR